MLMLEVFDVADPNACYRRKESIVPHQSLAMMNSGLVLDSARTLATQLADEDDFVTLLLSQCCRVRPRRKKPRDVTCFYGSMQSCYKKHHVNRFPQGGVQSSPLQQIYFYEQCRIWFTPCYFTTTL